ncbi:MAG: hypothetical protein R3B09_28715 [Nannocystaceae bacterium]
MAIDRKRGRFSSRDHETPPMLAGWEHVAASHLVEDAPQIAHEALQKLWLPRRWSRASGR